MADTFADLPDALVRDLLAQAMPIAEGITDHLNQLKELRGYLRHRIQDDGFLARKSDLDVPREPSTVGIDGSYQAHRLTALDLCAAAAVAVEGTAKDARRYWQEPYHRMWAGSFEHSKNSVNTLRGLMISMELALADEAPHDLVLLDGSFIVLLIYLNQGLSGVAGAPTALREEFLERWQEGKVLDRFLALLNSNRSVAVPKYSGRNELQSFLDSSLPIATDAKTIATVILEPDEYITPLPLFRFGSEDAEYHLPATYCSRRQQEQMNRSIEQMRVIFYKPYSWTPAIRLELPSPIAVSQARLSMVLEGIKRQFFTPAVMEPYPLFVADRMVKSLGSGVAVIEQAVAQLALGTTDDTEITMLCLQNYRTEGGRGGN